jgi:hypothetical protein
MAAIGVAGLAVAALAVPASAQFQSTAKLHVPFAFTAGKVAMPAGDYFVRRTAGNLLVVQNEETNEAATLATNPIDYNAKSKKVALVFLRSDKGATLAQARWFEGTMSYRNIPKGSEDRLAVITAD